MANLYEPWRTKTTCSSGRIGTGAPRSWSAPRVRPPPRKACTVHMQMVYNDAARNQLEELLLEVNATSEDVYVGNDAKFVAAVYRLKGRDRSGFSIHLSMHFISQLGPLDATDATDLLRQVRNKTNRGCWGGARADTIIWNH